MNKEFKQEVQEELDTIKAKATKEEIAKLDFEGFNADSSDSCIYGQMTGCCVSVRANELMPKGYSELYKGFGLDKIGNHFTRLEQYLCLVDSAQHEKVIQYLKGEIESIEL